MLCAIDLCANLHAVVQQLPALVSSQECIWQEDFGRRGGHGVRASHRCATGGRYNCSCRGHRLLMLDTGCVCHSYCCNWVGAHIHILAVVWDLWSCCMTKWRECIT
jgi:hypothetical protein